MAPLVRRYAPPKESSASHGSAPIAVAVAAPESAVQKAPLVKRYVPSKSTVAGNGPLATKRSPTSTDAELGREMTEKSGEQKSLSNGSNATTSARRITTVTGPMHGGNAGDTSSEQQKETKKKRKREKTTGADGSGPSIHPDRIAMVDGNGAGDTGVKRRKVGMAALKDSVDSDVDEESHKIQKKHGGVLAKYQKSTKRAALEKQPEQAELEAPRELRDLVPIPQPYCEATPEYKQTFSTLPPWVANPVTIAASAKESFNKLGVDKDTLERLDQLGFKEAFAVQSALIPRLLTRIRDQFAPVNDLCVGAPTGSGKTLAYTLPVAIALKGIQHRPKLRALIVVPTRELVQQVATMMAALTDKRVGVSVGHQNFSDEQAALVELYHEHDIARYEILMARVKRRQCFDLDAEDDDGDGGTLDLSDEQAEQYFKDCLEVPPFSVPNYRSKVDILVCTPGRLVEHLKSTIGFNLDNLEWLVIDEADQLLDQSFQDWVTVVNRALQREKKPERSTHCVTTPQTRYIRKVILSATMTKDVNHLNALQLRKPSMIVVQTDVQPRTHTMDDTEALDERKGEFELPSTLSESVIPIGDGGDKPLYLVTLLNWIIGEGSKHHGKLQSSKAKADVKINTDLADSESSSSSESDSSDSSSESSSATSDDDSDDSSSSNSDSSPSTMSFPASEEVAAGISTTDALSSPTQADPHVLIFTSSTSEAHRLSHLLGSLLPAVSCMVLTREQKSLQAIRAASSKIRVIISTDLASRGLDLALSHVINYTIPRSLESYVHRVGRTARAGRSGHAYSLVSDKEAAWFWNEIARNTQVKRGRVERQRFAIDDEWTAGEGRAKYDRVLAEMSAMVDEEGRKGKRPKSKVKS